MKNPGAYIIPSIILIATPAYAYEDEFYVYNGFEAAVGSFHRVALIFSDPNYQGLILAVIILGMLFGMISSLFRAGIGMKVDPLLSWAMPITLGVIVFLALVTPKGTLHIYDTVKNRYQAVDGIPDGMIALLGILNKIERGLVEIISTAGDIPPEVGYDRQAGGVGFNILLGIGQRGVWFDDLHINQSLKKYTEDCLVFGINNPQPALNIDPNEVATNADFLSVLAQANYNPIYTVYFSDSNPGGIELTCSQAWPRLRADLTATTNYTSISKAKCASAGFDPTIPAQLTQCKAVLSDAVNWLENSSGSYTAEKVFRQAAIAQAIDTIIRKYSPDAAIKALTDRNAGVAMISTGIAANEWIPIIRAVVLAIAVGLTPFLVMFLPTPLFPKVVGMIAGFFIWITAWGITDAIVHQFAMDYAWKAFEDVRRHQLGLHAIMMFETSSMKTLAAFGAIRWSGAMLATVMTMMIIRFGGHAMAMFAGQVGAPARIAGAEAGRMAMTPEGSSRAMLSQSEAAAYWQYAEKFNWSNRTGLGYFGHAQKMEGARQTVKAIGKGSFDNRKNIEDTANKLGHVFAMSNTQKASEAKHYDPQNSLTIGDTRGQSTLGDMIGKRSAAADAGTTVAGQAEYVSYINWSRSFGRGKGAEAFAAALGMDGVRELSKFRESGSLVTEEVADWLNRQGFSEVAAGMRVKDMSVDRDTGDIGYLEVDGNIGAPALNDIASGFVRRGHFNAALKTEAMANNLRSDETANVRLQYGAAGDLATGHVKHGTEALHYDVAQKRWIDQQVEGRDHVVKDVDKTVVNHSYTEDTSYSEKRGYMYDSSETYKMGPQYDPNTMLNAVVTGGHDFDRLTGSLLLGETSTQYANRDAQHRALAEGLTKITRHEGSMDGQARGKASAGFRFFGTGATGELIETSSEKEAINLHLANVARLNEEAWTESGGDTHKFDPEMYTQLRHEKFKSYYDDLMGKVEEDKPDQYGADMPLTKVEKVAQPDENSIIGEITGDNERTLNARINLANDMNEQNLIKRAADQTIKEELRKMKDEK